MLLKVPPKEKKNTQTAQKKNRNYHVPFIFCRLHAPVALTIISPAAQFFSLMRWDMSWNWWTDETAEHRIARATLVLAFRVWCFLFCPTVKYMHRDAHRFWARSGVVRVASKSSEHMCVYRKRATLCLYPPASAQIVFIYYEYTTECATGESTCSGNQMCLHE